MGSLGTFELIMLLLLIVGVPIAIIILLLKRRNNSGHSEASNTVSMSELQAATSQTLQDSLTPLENKIDALVERIDALEGRQSK
ncbi:MAG: hypothetical protein E2O84_01630 [Bacteroidetes bacterium]|nr:MAG: hypothetical protein E2O84_01630 [Bacteroidota bacterium]